MTDAAVPVSASTARRLPLRTTGSMRHVAQSPRVDSTVFQQGLLLLLAGTAAAYMAMRMVWALVRSLPLIAVVVYYAKPSLESFMEFLSLKDKRSSSSEATSAGSPRTGNSEPAGWLKKVVSKTIQKTSAALCLNPVREWLYLDLGLFVLCKKKPSAFEGLSAALSGGTAPPAPKVFAIGFCFQWFLLDPIRGGEDWPWWKIYGYELASLLSSQWPDAKWNTFSSLPAVQRRNDTQRSAAVEAVVATTAAVVGEAWKEVVEASNQNSSSNSNRHSCGSSRLRHSSVVNVSSPPIEEISGAAVAGMMGEMEDKSMRRHMHLAQEFAERGRFEEAGKAVELALEKVRGGLRGGVEEETEVLLVACAFYEAGSPSS